MGAVDTNVLVRLITRDEAREAAAADVCVERGAWVPQLAVAEFARVLSTLYDFDAREIAEAVELLLQHKSLTLQESDVVARALELFRRRPALGFSDCLMLEV